MAVSKGDMRTDMDVNSKMLLAGRLLPMVRRTPFVIRLQVLAVAVALVAAVGLPGLYGPVDYERSAFAIPAGIHQRAAWEDEVGAFAARMHRVFGVRQSVADEFSGWILEASTRQSLAPELVASVIFTESSFRKNVKSHVGAMGPAQVRPYWRGFCGSDLGDPEENVYCGAQIISHYQTVCGNERCALVAYNVGINQDDELMHTAGRRYVRKIDKHRARLDATIL
jgi:soluble lytic murein transglycosylase-like protein